MLSVVKSCQFWSGKEPELTTLVGTNRLGQSWRMLNPEKPEADVLKEPRRRRRIMQKT